MINMKKTTLLVTIISIAFFTLYAWLATPVSVGVSTGYRFDWPDETANYFWIHYYAKTGQLVVEEPLNLVADNQIHPRSFNVRPDGSLVPGSFLGLILFYGWISKLLGSWIILYLTPLFGVLGVLAFYGIIRRLFDDQVGLLTTILILIHPAWWYYSATTLLPNVTFLSLVTAGAYFLYRREALNFWSALGSGLAFGLALAVRPAEIVWVGLVVLVSVGYGWKHNRSLVLLVVTIAAAVLAFLPTLYWQQLIYGDLLTTGYDQLTVASASSCQACAVAQSLFTPFGLHPNLIGHNLYLHYFRRLWWYVLLMIFGLAVFLANPGQQKNRRIGYLLFGLVISLLLAVYYGSWEFTDQLTVNLNTLGISYVRYFLPLYILPIPFIAAGLISTFRYFAARWAALFLLLILVGVGYLSAQLVLYQKADSLMPVRQRVAEYRVTAAAVYEKTETESVIITVRKDKLFFPDRKVIHTFEALSLNSVLQEITPQLAKQVPVYYYALGPEPQLTYDQFSLEVIAQFGSEVLYRVIL